MATVDTTTTTDNNPTVTATETITTTTVKDVSESTMNNGCDKKEEEPISTPTPTITPKKDNENENVNPKSDDKTEEELLKAGTKLITEEKYSEACDILSSAMELIQQKKIVNTIESVKYYMAYGEALLRLVQSSNDLFAAPVRESQQQHLAEMEEEDDDIDLAEPQLVTDATEKSEESKENCNGATKPENSGNSKEEQDEDDDVDLVQSQKTNSKEEADDEPEAAPAAAQGNGDVDTSDDREYAWESFEYARGIIEEYLNKEENKDNNDNDEYLALLASAHAFLGELLIEDERNDDALTEFNKAIELQNKCKLSTTIKVRSRASNHFMACLAAQFADKDDEAVKHCDAALKGLSERISGLLTQFECTESTEIKENEYQQVIKIAEDFMGDTEKFTDTKKNSEDGKELKDLVGVMGDLCAKLEEVKEIIQLKKDGKYGNANDTAQGQAAQSGIDAQLMMDPLQALISGLTSKFGIDEEQLAAMAADESDDENKNTSNKNVSVPNGVTTIGFGNVATSINDDEVNDLDLCVKRKSDKKNTDIDNKKEEKKPTQISGKKRKMSDADIDDGMNEVNGAAKKMKLNSGDASTVVVANNNNEDGK